VQHKAAKTTIAALCVLGGEILQAHEAGDLALMTHYSIGARSDCIYARNKLDASAH